MSSQGSSERYRLVEDVFQRAADLPEDRRRDFLARHCGSDPGLREEVEALLRSYAVAGDCFDRPLYVRPTTDDEADPVRIGRYEVRRRLGQGGMAVVFEATQEQPRRSVAVKLIRPGAFSARSRSRFEFEAAVLARLQHPGIAHIYEAGIAEVAYPGGGMAEQPFFAMELVQGETLVQYVTRQALDTARRLGLFIKICDAVEHAHQKGVIHRDLKPSNIVITPAGEPKVLDFGVARLTEPDVQLTTLQSETGQLVGTLPYMSPEQVSGRLDQLDTRSDVYALGVVLYELLAGRLPYDVAGKPIAAAAAVITDTPPAPLGTVDRAHRGDLDTIVTKALEKDPARRYASVQALSEDVRRFLGHEPIAARPPSAIYQVRMFARRNRALVGGLAAAFASLVIGLSVAAYGLVAASAERDRKTAALNAESLARGEAEAVAAFLGDMLAAADPKRKGHDARVVDLLKESSESISEKFADQPLIQARLRHVIGTTYQHLGLYDQAEPHLRYALDTRTRLLGERSPDTIDALHELGALYNQWGRYSEAEPLDLRALELNREARGAESEQTLNSMHELSLLYSRQGRYQESLPLGLESVRLGGRLLGEDHATTLSAANNLGLLYKRLGRYDDALALYEQTLTARKRTLGDEHPDTLSSMNNLAHLYRSLGRPEDSAELHARTLAIRRRVLTDEHPQTVMSMDNLAMLLTDLERYAEAEALYLEALKHKRRIYGDEGPDTLVSMNNLARNYSNQKRYEEAEQLLGQTLEVRNRVLGDNHRDTLDSITDMGLLLRAQDKLDEAEPHFLRALEGYRRTLGDDHPETLKTMNNMGLVLMEQQKMADAEPYFREALKGNRRILGDDHPDTLGLTNNLGLVLRVLDRHSEAKAFGAEAVQKARRVLPAGRWETGVFIYQHAQTLAEMERFADAEAEFLEAHGILVGAVGESHVRTTRCVKALIGLYDAWHAAEPERGYDQNAAEWRGTFAEWQTSTQPSAARESGAP